MSVFILAAKQLLLLTFLGIIGYGLRKAAVVSDSDKACFSWLVLKVGLPALILHAFQTTAGAGMGKSVFFSVLLYSAVILSSLGIGWLSGRLSRCPGEKMGVWLFGHMFSNGGNLGMVIISALYSGPVLIYTAFFMFVSNVFQAIVGTGILGHYGSKTQKKCIWKTILTNPPVLAGLIGFVLMVCHIQLPEIGLETLVTLKNLTAPLSMFFIGTMLADAQLVELVKKGRMYVLTTFRLVLIPLVVFALLRIIRVEPDMIVSLVMITAMPCATNMAIYAEQYGNDALYASQLIAQSTLLSFFTIPLFVALLSYIG